MDAASEVRTRSCLVVSIYRRVMTADFYSPAIAVAAEAVAMNKDLLGHINLQQF